jgi:DNA repair and recombination protein RAD52
MFLTPEQRRQLSGPLDKRFVQTRSQAGQSLGYIEAWYAIDQANQIFGWAWDRETVELRLVNADTYEKTRFDQQSGRRVPVTGADGAPVDMNRCGYVARVRVTVRTEGGTIVRDGTGYGGGYGEDPGLAHEGAVKEAETDATKRALATLGHPLGLALYDRDRRNVGTPTDASFWSDALAAIEAVTTGAELKAWWRDNATQVAALPEGERRAVVEAKDAKKAALNAADTGGEGARPLAAQTPKAASNGRTSRLDSIVRSNDDDWDRDPPANW